MGGAGCYAGQVKLIRFHQEIPEISHHSGSCCVFFWGEGSSLQLTQCTKSFERKVWGSHDIPHVLVYSRATRPIFLCGMAQCVASVLYGMLPHREPHLVLKHFSRKKNHINRLVAEWWRRTPPILAFVFQRQGAIISKSYTTANRNQQILHRRWQWKRFPYWVLETLACCT